MCSVNEEDLDVANLKLDNKYQSNLKHSLCKKCSEEKASIVLRTKDPYCRSCFLKYATHKFRATLGKSKLVRPRDRILIASSGGQSSVTLLHLVAEGLSEQANKRFLFTPLVAHVDEGAVTGASSEERLEAMKAVAMQVERLNFPLYTVQLSNALNLERVQMFNVNSKGEGIDLSENKIVAGDEQLLALFNAITTLTAKEDLLGKMRQNLLLAVAKELNCSKIFLADNGSQLAVSLISNVAAGRGACLPWDIGFCDVRDPAVMILRPLKEFMSKEIAFYCIFNSLVPVTLPSFSTKASRMASIRRLTEDFLHGLHVDFPSTFSSVIKTGDKLAPPSQEQERCVLCKVVLIEEGSRECSSRLATRFSRELVGQICGAVPERSPESDDGASSGGHRPPWTAADGLCYGCRLTLADMA